MNLTEMDELRLVFAHSALEIGYYLSKKEKRVKYLSKLRDNLNKLDIYDFFLFLCFQKAIFKTYGLNIDNTDQFKKYLSIIIKKIEKFLDNPQNLDEIELKLLEKLFIILSKLLLELEQKTYLPHFKEL